MWQAGASRRSLLLLAGCARGPPLAQRPGALDGGAELLNASRSATQSVTTAQGDRSPNPPTRLLAAGPAESARFRRARGPNESTRSPAAEPGAPGGAGGSPAGLGPPRTGTSAHVSPRRGLCRASPAAVPFRLTYPIASRILWINGAIPELQLPISASFLPSGARFYGQGLISSTKTEQARGCTYEVRSDKACPTQPKQPKEADEAHPGHDVVGAGPREGFRCCSKTAHHSQPGVCAGRTSRPSEARPTQKIPVEVAGDPPPNDGARGQAPPPASNAASWRRGRGLLLAAPAGLMCVAFGQRHL